MQRGNTRQWETFSGKNVQATKTVWSFTDQKTCSSPETCQNLEERILWNYQTLVENAEFEKCSREFLQEYW